MVRSYVRIIRKTSAEAYRLLTVKMPLSCLGRLPPVSESSYNSFL